MTVEQDGKTVRQFILRARRVQAHSLVQNRHELTRYARGQFSLSLNYGGQTTITRYLPDEEAFESLASRIRPLTVKSEPIYYAKVFDAIGRLIVETDLDDSLRIRLSDLRQAWDTSEIQGTQTQAYSMQSVQLDGGGTPNNVSDTQLAAGWLYADLVHAEAHGPKRESLVFPLRERYAAAVRVFSHLAVLVVATLKLVEALRDASVLVIDGLVWADDVVVGTTELVEAARVYVAPPGSEVPDIRHSFEATSEWQSLTVTELLRLDPANRVQTALHDENNYATETFEASIAHRKRKTSSVDWDVLVAGSVLFKFSLDIDDEQITGVHFLGMKPLDSTNELNLASTIFLLKYYRAAAMSLSVGGNELLRLNPPFVADDTSLELAVLAETLEDIVSIERLSDRVFTPCKEGFDDRDRVRLRCTRLLMEGQVVRAARAPVTVTAPSDNPPHVLMIDAGTLNVGGTEVPIPRLLMAHPAMTVTEVGTVSGAGLDNKVYRVEPPEGERFLAWLPGLVSISEISELAATRSWELIGVNELSFKY